MDLCNVDCFYNCFLVIASGAHWVFTPWDTNEARPEEGQGFPAAAAAPGFHECSDSPLLRLTLEDSVLLVVSVSTAKVVYF